ncbi:transposase, IS605 OrfB family protein [Calothrix sp. NIES-4101]|nr:transposase, IS605 OrfB family protein [Calothrix sp. NIES-4101]
MRLEYFAVKFNKQAIAVPPQYTSQKCSDCGSVVKKSLSTRTHKCSCGCELHRDTNAAKNILNLGRAKSLGCGSAAPKAFQEARTGQVRSNANGLVTSTLLGEAVGGVGFRPVKLPNPSG